MLGWILFLVRRDVLLGFVVKLMFRLVRVRRLGRGGCRIGEGLGGSEVRGLSFLRFCKFCSRRFSW